MNTLEQSTRWALEQLERANHIFEPYEKTWWSQLVNLLIWAAELAVICLLVPWLTT